MMRAMAHPARLAILEHLGKGAEATATECAEVCGLSPSATSYHLRALAKFGLVEAAPSRGDGRERVWRSTVRAGFRIDETVSRSPEDLAAAVALVDVWFARDLRRALDWALEADRTEPKEWADAAAVVGHRLVMTAEELSRVRDAVLALIEPYAKHQRTDPPEGARDVNSMFVAFPSS
jgi:DNA-binding transcriptional ArsR family regulator